MAEDTVKVIARNATDCVLSRPSRNEVREELCERRWFQSQSEGLFCPAYIPFRPLGSPVYQDTLELMKSGVGRIPRLPDMFKFKLTPDEKMDVDSASQEFMEPENPFYKSVVLSSQSVEKSTESLHPFLDLKNLKISTDTENRAIAKYIERCKRSGIMNMKDVLAESNDSAKRTKQGHSYFEFLYKALCAKVLAYWNERRRMVRSAEETIRPPNRKYIEEYTIKDSSKTIDTQNIEGDIEALLQELYNVELKTEADALVEDKLIAMEPQMIKLTMKLFPNYADVMRLHGSRERKSTGSSSPVSKHSLGPAVERRRQRQKVKWNEEQPRPFAPRFFNICRPEVAQEFARDQVVKQEVKKCGSTEEPVESSASSVNLNQEACKTEEPDEEETTSVGEKSQALFEWDEKNEEENICIRILYTQLCALAWLLEQMTNKALKGEDALKPIFFSWRHLCALNIANEESALNTDQINQDWAEFVRDFDLSSKLKRRASRRSTAWSASGRHSRQFIRRATRSRLLSLKSEFGRRSMATAITKPSDPDNPDNWYVEYLLTEEENHQKMRKGKQRPKVTDVLETEEQHQLCKRPWINVHALRQGIPRRILGQMAKIVESNLRETDEDKLSNRRKYSVKLSPIYKPLEHVEFRSAKHRKFLKDAPTKFASLLEAQAIKFHDRTQKMRDLQESVLITKYQSLPANARHHVMLKRLQHDASYADATVRLTRLESKMRDPAPWYVDLMHDISIYQDHWMLKNVLSKLERFAQLPVSQFTVVQFTTTLRRLQMWELCSPVVSAAVDFVRTRILDMTLEEYTEWLYDTYPELKECREGSEDKRLIPVM